MVDPEFPFHASLNLQNFTVFADQTFEFVPGLNVLVGENGTGKTHVMKALYAWQLARHLADTGQDADYARVFAETYGAKTGGELQRAKTRAALVSGTFGPNAWKVGLLQHLATDNGVRPAAPRPVFIPAIEMMAHARNMNGILRDYADFDRTCFDFVSLVTAQPNSYSLSDADWKAVNRAVEPLQKLVPGQVTYDDTEQRFYLTDKKLGLPFSLVAEGFRKIAALSRLIQFGWLPPGSVLFWDEPEVNLNPKWMEEVIKALVALARSGVQIFLATHNYVILKEIDLVLRSQNRKLDPVSVRFFGLHKERGVSRAMWSDDFAAIEPNPILDQYDQMLMEDMRLQQDEAKSRQ